MNISLILGNLCSLLAMATDSISSAQKTAKRVLIVQNLSQVIYFTGGILLKGYSGAVQNAVSFLRNMIAIWKIESKVIEWILLVLGVALGLACNNLGWVGLLPVLANLQYTLAVFRFKDNEQALKLSFMVCCILFVVFNSAIYNFVGAGTNLVVIVTIIANLLKSRKNAE